MDKTSIYLWFANPEDLLSEAASAACATLLSEDERARWKDLRFDRLRREYLTTRALVRNALSYYCPLAPEAWRFQVNRYGKPSPDPECGLRFNLSNSPELVVCAIAGGIEVGVDAEPHERAEKIAELSLEVFSPEELAQLEGLPRVEKMDRALSLWTLKEAYIKARGMGLSLPLKQVSFLFGGANGVRLELDCDDGAERWRFCLLERAGHRIALVAETIAFPELEAWEMRGMPVSPMRVPIGEVRWFPAP